MFARARSLSLAPALSPTYAFEVRAGRILRSFALFTQCWSRHYWALVNQLGKGLLGELWLWTVLALSARQRGNLPPLRRIRIRRLNIFYSGALKNSRHLQRSHGWDTKIVVCELPKTSHSRKWVAIGRGSAKYDAKASILLYFSPNLSIRSLEICSLGCNLSIYF